MKAWMIYSKWNKNYFEEEAAIKHSNLKTPLTDKYFMCTEASSKIKYEWMVGNLAVLWNIEIL